MRVSQVHDLQRLDDTLGYQIGASLDFEMEELTFPKKEKEMKERYRCSMC